MIDKKIPSQDQFDPYDGTMNLLCDHVEAVELLARVDRAHLQKNTEELFLLDNRFAAAVHL